MHDNSHYSKIIDKHKDLAFSIALKILKNEQDAEEIVQDAFIKAFRSMDRFKGESRFFTWFYRIVYNTAISRYRGSIKKDVETVYEESSTVDFTNFNQAVYDLDHQDRKALIQEAMSALDELDYTILSLYYLENKDLKAISTITGKKRNYLKVLLQRARHKFHNNLNNTLKRELKELSR